MVQYGRSREDRSDEEAFRAMNGVNGYMYPNEISLYWSVLIVLYPYITGLVAGAFILASLVRIFQVKAVAPTYRLALLTALAFLIVAPLPVAAAPRPPGTILRDVLYAARHLRDGHVWLRLPVVPDGGAGVRDLAGLSARHHSDVAIDYRNQTLALSCALAWFDQSQRGIAGRR